MKTLFTNKYYFSILFFGILFLDIFVKLNFEAIPYRLFIKPFVVLSLMVFFIIDNHTNPKPKFHFVITALLVFLIGDVLLIFFENINLYIMGIVLFVVGKVFYTLRFSNQRDFNIFSLLPFFVLCFIYMASVMLLIMNNLGAFFIPTLLYLFSCLIAMLFAYLRKGDVNSKSFYLVLLGVSVAIICDTITVIQSFYFEEFPFHEFLIMFLYGLSQYFIILGLSIETKLENKYVTF